MDSAGATRHVRGQPADGNLPETTQVFTSRFGGQRDYARDPLIHRAIDRSNEMVYILPIASLPTGLVHARNVRVDNLLAANGVEIADYSWK